MSPGIRFVSIYVFLNCKSSQSSVKWKYFSKIYTEKVYTQKQKESEIITLYITILLIIFIDFKWNIFFVLHKWRWRHKPMMVYDSIFNYCMAIIIHAHSLFQMQSKKNIFRCMLCLLAYNFKSIRIINIFITFSQ